MNGDLLKEIISNWHISIPIIIIVGTALWKAIWKASLWFHGVNVHMDTSNGFMVKTDEKLVYLTRRIDALYDFLINRSGRAVDISSSPLSLSDYGEQISQAVDAPSLAESYAKRLQAQSADMNPYQIQELCFDFSRDNLLHDLKEHDNANYDKLTRCAFKEGIEVEKILRVIGILMRDILLNQAGHAPTAVDDRAPQTSDS